MKVNFALCASALSLAIAAIIIDIASLVAKTHNTPVIAFREVSSALALAVMAEMLLLVYLLMKLREIAAKEQAQRLLKKFPAIAGTIAVVVLLVAYTALLVMVIYSCASIPANTPANLGYYLSSLFMAIASALVALCFLASESKNTADTQDDAHQG